MHKCVNLEMKENVSLKMQTDTKQRFLKTESYKIDIKYVSNWWLSFSNWMIMIKIKEPEQNLGKINIQAKFKLYTIHHNQLVKNHQRKYRKNTFSYSEISVQITTGVKSTFNSQLFPLCQGRHQDCCSTDKHHKCPEAAKCWKHVPAQSKLSHVSSRKVYTFVPLRLRSVESCLCLRFPHFSCPVKSYFLFIGCNLVAAYRLSLILHVFSKINTLQKFLLHFLPPKLPINLTKACSSMLTTVLVCLEVFFFTRLTIPTP